MTCCVLTGFKKAKKHVGGVYACDGSDLPATQDFGTVQFSGPYETAQTVPATEVTYTIIGKTQCGDDIRRITTKTYSSRSVANQHKATYSGGGYTNQPDYTGISHDSLPALFFATVGYGSTFSAAAINWDLNIYNLCNDLGKDAFASTPTVYYQGVSRLSSAGPGFDTVLTLYYLDVHEVWTYDLV